MSYDLVVLTRETPKVDDLVHGMAAAGEELGVRQVANGAVIQLCAADERPLVSIEVPALVQVPGEVERVLGPIGDTEVEVPVSWLEVRAAHDQHAIELARTFAAELADRLDGQVWPPRHGPDGRR